jgi:hypothetical protein
MSVVYAYDVADFYEFTVHWKNTCKQIVKVQGEFFVKTSNGSVYGRPDPGYISFHNGLCGGGNYFSFYANPGEETSGNPCNTVKLGAKVVSYFMAMSPVSKPSISLNGKWTLK